LLEKEKKDRNWSDFLLELYKEYKTSRSRIAYEELRNLLDEKDLNGISKSIEEFRRRFKFR